MSEAYFNLLQDKHIRRYSVFLLLFSLLLFTAGAISCISLTNSAKAMLLSHDETIVSSLIEQGIPEEIIASALTDTDTVHTQTSADLLAKLGIRPSLDVKFLPSLHQFRTDAQSFVLITVLLLCLLLLVGSFFFLQKRDRLYRHASSVIENYINGDYSCHLPQTTEGTVYQMFSSVDRLATMLQAQSETEYKSKIFLRNTISDISHQLKTPLAALSMYQEIMEKEPDHPDVIREFAAKTGLALERMEQLIQSMLKITCLDAGSIVFEKSKCSFSELTSRALSELSTRAEKEGKEILLEGSPAETLICDMAWTSEAIGNIVKNALDHTDSGASIRISWDVSPTAARILISDDGEGIAPEDIHHIFKRFYRSSKSLDIPGIGLGLPLAKSIVEGQGGTISVRSTPHVGTTFVLLFMP